MTRPLPQMMLIGAILAACAGSSIAQDAPFPQRGSIEMTVLFPAGSSADVTAHVIEFLAGEPRHDTARLRAGRAWLLHEQERDG